MRNTKNMSHCDSPEGQNDPEMPCGERVLCESFGVEHFLLTIAE